MIRRRRLTPAVVLAGLSIGNSAFAQTAPGTCPAVDESTQTIKDLSDRALAAAAGIKAALDGAKETDTVLLAANTNLAMDLAWAKAGRPPLPHSVPRTPTSDNSVPRAEDIASDIATSVKYAPQATPAVTNKVQSLEIMQQVMATVADGAQAADLPASTDCQTPLQSLQQEALAASVQINKDLDGAAATETPEMKTGVNTALDKFWSNTGRPAFSLGIPVTPTPDVINLRTKAFADGAAISTAFATTTTPLVEPKVIALKALADTIHKVVTPPKSTPKP